MSHKDEVDLYALYGSYNTYESCWSVRTQKTKYENAAINGDAKLTSIVEEQNRDVGPQCRQRTTQCATNQPPMKANAAERRRSLNIVAKASKRRNQEERKDNQEERKDNQHEQWSVGCTTFIF